MSTQKLNGYVYNYKTRRKCENAECRRVCRTGGWGANNNVQVRLYELNGKKVCRMCAKEANIIA
jgi:hypothetical protein